MAVRTVPPSEMMMPRSSVGSLDYLLEPALQSTTWKDQNLLVLSVRHRLDTGVRRTADVVLA